MGSVTEGRRLRPGRVRRVVAATRSPSPPSSSHTPAFSFSSGASSPFQPFPDGARASQRDVEAGRHTPRVRGGAEDGETQRRNGGVAKPRSATSVSSSSGAAPQAATSEGAWSGGGGGPRAGGDERLGQAVRCAEGTWWWSSLDGVANGLRDAELERQPRRQTKHGPLE